MKIFMATMGLDIGGAETHIVELAKQLKAQGHDIAIASNGGVYVPEITQAASATTPSPCTGAAYPICSAPVYAQKIIAKETPTCPRPRPHPRLFVRLPAKKAEVPLCHLLPRGVSASGVLKLLSNWGQRTLAVSEDIRDYLIAQYSVPPEHITLTINGIDTDKFPRKLRPGCAGGVLHGPGKTGGLLRQPHGRGPGYGGPAAH